VNSDWFGFGSGVKTGVTGFVGSVPDGHPGVGILRVPGVLARALFARLGSLGRLRVHHIQAGELVGFYDRLVRVLVLLVRRNGIPLVVQLLLSVLVLAVEFFLLLPVGFF
jgi:hypothetical protein